MTAWNSSWVSEAGTVVFGESLPLARRYAELLAEQGVDRGVIGPREVDRLWERHLLNSAVLAELLPRQARVLDVGSGAGLPGIPLAIARPDLSVVLLEPMARRVEWLREVVTELELTAEVVRGRAEEEPVREQWGEQDVVTARAVAPLGRLASWCLPLVRPGGQLLALKGASAAEELDRDAAEVVSAGGVEQRVVSCGDGVLEVPTTVVEVQRTSEPRGEAGSRKKAAARRRGGTRRTRKDR